MTTSSAKLPPKKPINQLYKGKTLEEANNIAVRYAHKLRVISVDHISKPHKFDAQKNRINLTVVKDVITKAQEY